MPLLNWPKKTTVVIVIGGAHSNNTHELVKTCLQFCARVHHVQTAAELQPEWFSTGDIVGITAGTSTPDAIINSVENAIQVWTASSWGTATEATPPAMSR